MLSPALSAQQASEEQLAFFEKRIRPVLVEHCYQCHSRNAAAKEKLRGGLYLDSRQGILKGGESGAAAIVGKPAESLLISALKFESFEMPPAGKLTADVIADFEKWIADGMADPRDGQIAADRKIDINAGREFWAYQPLSQPAIPTVAGVQPGTPIDAFIIHKLQEQGMKQVGQADRSVIARRLYYDLVGLPPSIDQIESFVKDTRPDAYEQLVDRLLSSPAFGERWGRHWLDVVRYAESITLRGLLYREAWRFRDAVISSFNADVPFNVMARQQVSGDLMEAASREQREMNLLLTGFLSMGNNNLEDQDKAKLRMDVVDEQLETIGRAFLAQTIGCARCHDHKFDPIPTKDYYALAGILRSTESVVNANVGRWVELDMPLPEAEQKQLDAVNAQIAALKQEITKLQGSGGDNAPIAVDALEGIVVDDLDAKLVGAWTKSTSSKNFVGANYQHDGAAGKGEKSAEFTPPEPLEGEYEVRFAVAHGGNRAPKVNVTVWSADGESTTEVNQQKKPPILGRFVSLGKHRFTANTDAKVTVSTANTTQHVIIDAVQFLPVDLKGSPTKVVTDEDAKERAAALKVAQATLKKLEAERPSKIRYMTVSEQKEIGDTQVHIRGNAHNLGESVSRGFLQVVSHEDSPAIDDTQSGRRQLGDWLVSSQNPLAPRVYANRIWHWLIGTGIVRTVDNFGTTGELPSHPELLDYLASRFVENGWSTKQLVREIVLSSTYQLSSNFNENYSELDPENRLLSSMNRRRIDAESLLDTLLVTSGSIDNRLGGSLIPAGITTDYDFPHDSRRRAVYWPVFRNSLPDLFVVFDFANPSMVVGRRDVSSTAPQSLFLMNNDWVIQQSQQMADKWLAQHELDVQSRTEAVVYTILGRKPRSSEQQLIMQYVVAAGDDKMEQQRRWTQVIQTLFSSVDFRYIY
tara:strand:- start:912 stop:3680 length:2769 start_codon:yes stop_codon:yes gene_type:complete